MLEYVRFSLRPQRNPPPPRPASTVDCFHLFEFGITHCMVGNNKSTHHFHRWENNDNHFLLNEEDGSINGIQPSRRHRRHAQEGPSRHGGSRGRHPPQRRGLSRDIHHHPHLPRPERHEQARRESPRQDHRHVRLRDDSQVAGDRAPRREDAAARGRGAGLRVRRRHEPGR